MQAKRWLSTEIFLLGIGEIFQLEPSAMCLQNKLSSPFVFILYYSDYRWFTTTAKHIRSFEIQWNKAYERRSTPTMARNSGIDVAALGMEAFKSPIKLDPLSRAILIEPRGTLSRRDTRWDSSCPEDDASLSRVLLSARRNARVTSPLLPRY